MNSYLKVPPFRSFLSLAAGMLCSPAGAYPREADALPEVTLGLACDHATPDSLKEISDWDGRFSFGPPTRDCLDSSKRIKFTPARAELTRNPFSESMNVIIEVSQEDGERIHEFFRDALERGPRRELILVGGKVIASPFITSQFSGTKLWIDPASDEKAKGMALLFSSGYRK